MPDKTEASEELDKSEAAGPSEADALEEALTPSSRSAVTTAMTLATRSLSSKNPEQFIDVFGKALNYSAEYEERTNLKLIRAQRNAEQRRLAITILALIALGGGAAAFALYYFLSSPFAYGFLTMSGTATGFIPVLATGQPVTVAKAARLISGTRKALSSTAKRVLGGTKQKALGDSKKKALDSPQENVVKAPKQTHNDRDVVPRE